MPSSDNPDVKDPIEFCGHIPSEVKKTQQRIAMKKLEEEMTEDQKVTNLNKTFLNQYTCLRVYDCFLWCLLPLNMSCRKEISGTHLLIM